MKYLCLIYSDEAAFDRTPKHVVDEALLRPVYVPLLGGFQVNEEDVVAQARAKGKELAAVLPAGAREVSQYLRRNKSIEFTHGDAITFITRQGGTVQVLPGTYTLRIGQDDASDLDAGPQRRGSANAVARAPASPDFAELFCRFGETAAVSSWLHRSLSATPRS